jgi:hypothetical protein
LAPITNLVKHLSSYRTRTRPIAILRAVFLAAAVFFLSQHHGLWVAAAFLILIVELGFARTGSKSGRRDLLKIVMERVPIVLVGLSSAMIIAVVPRFVTQVAVALCYLVVRFLWEAEADNIAQSLPGLLIVTAAQFEALFLMAAVWRTSEWLILVLVWICAYLSVYAVLSNRAERVAGVMAAAWALICIEISWVLLRWLFTYTLTGGYLLVPQPMLILTALAYCFGSIYVSQRKGSLSRGRLTEYLLIGLILIAIVITGTPWRGSL